MTKNWNRLISLILALVMVMGMTLTGALAATGGEPESEQSEACETCGKSPCECEKTEEEPEPANAGGDESEQPEVCEECGQAPCECEKAEEEPEPANAGGEEGEQPEACEECGKAPCECGEAEEEPEPANAGGDEGEQPEACEECGQDPCVCAELAAQVSLFSDDGDESDGVTTEAALQEALKKGGTVKLGADITLAAEPGGVKVYSDVPAVVLDLNGHTIYGGVWVYGTLTITDSVGGGTVSNTQVEGRIWPAVENNGGNLTIEGGIFTGPANNWGSSLLNFNHGTVLIKDGTFEKGVQNGTGSDSSTMTIEGGEFKAYSFAPGPNEVVNMVALLNVCGKATIYGGTICGEKDIRVVENDDAMVFEGGTVIGEIWNYGASARLNIKDGSFTGDICDLSGGVQTQISGGTFSSNVSQYLIENMIQGEDGKVGVDLTNIEAMVNGMYYESLQDAINAAQSNQTVKLLRDVETDAELLISRKDNITLDGGKHTVTVNADADCHGIQVWKSTVTIKNITITGAGKDGLLVNGGSVVTAENLHTHDNAWGGVNVDHGSTFNATGLDCQEDNKVWSEDAGTEDGSTVSIDGFVTVYGIDGTKVHFTTKEAAESNDKVVAVVGTVYYGSVQDAIDAAQSGETVTLMRDAKLNGSEEAYVLVENKELTLDLNGHTASGGYLWVDGNDAKVTVTDSSEGGAGKIEGTTSTYGIHVTGGAVNVTGGTVSNHGHGILMEGENTVVTIGGEGKTATVKNTNANTKLVYTGIWVRNGATLYVEDGAVIDSEGDGIAMARAINKVADTGGANLVMTGGFVHGAYRGIIGDGTKNTGATRIDISGGEITGQIGIYHPQPGTMTIGGDAEITGYVGVQMCAGELTVTGGAITANTIGNSANGYKIQTGPIPDGAAVSVVDRNYPGGTATAKIEGGTITSEKSEAVLAYTWTWTETMDEDSGKKTGAGVVSEWAETSEHVTISGGTFSSDVSEYCAEGYHATVSGDMWTVARITVESAIPASYTVTVAAAENGTVRVSRTSAAAGATVTVTAEAAEGYELESITVTRANGAEVEVTETGSGVRFVMPAGRVTVTAVFTELTDIEDEDTPLGEGPISAVFADVSDEIWYAGAVRFVYAEGLMKGVAEDAFGPDAETNRSMVVTMLHRLEDTPDAGPASFEDVLAGAWYAKAVDWGSETGVVSGYGNGSFGPGDVVTREQLAVFLYRYARYKGYDVSAKGDLSAFADADSVSDWAVDAMTWAVGAGLIRGTGAGLEAQGTATRAEVAAVFMRFCESLKGDVA